MGLKQKGDFQRTEGLRHSHERTLDVRSKNQVGSMMKVSESKPLVVTFYGIMDLNFRTWFRELGWRNWAVMPLW